MHAGLLNLSTFFVLTSLRTVFTFLFPFKFANSRGSVISNFTIVYYQIPNIELLIIQEAIDNIGKIDQLNVTYMNVSSNDGRLIYDVFFLFFVPDFKGFVRYSPLTQ